MVDLYFKNENDITYDELLLEETSELQILISQIKMLLFTNNGDVLGSPSLGLNLETLIFETSYNKFIILNNLKTQIERYLVYDDKKYQVEYDIVFYRGTIRDIAILSILINGQNSLDIMIK